MESIHHGRGLRLMGRIPCCHMLECGGTFCLQGPEAESSIFSMGSTDSARMCLRGTIASSSGTVETVLPSGFLASGEVKGAEPGSFPGEGGSPRPL